MATVEFIDGRVVHGVRLTNVKIGEEGSKTAIAHLDGKTYEVYNSIIDGFDPVWYEQISYETWKMLKGKGEMKFVEGSTSEPGAMLD